MKAFMIILALSGQGKPVGMPTAHPVTLAQCHWAQHNEAMLDDLTRDARKAFPAAVSTVIYCQEIE